MIQLELPNLPIAWSASRITSRGAFNPRAKEKNFTRWQIKSLYRDKPIQGYVVIEFVFIFPIPNSVSRSKRESCLKNNAILPTKCDCTNLQKFYEDCIKGIVITDDRNVAKISSEKIYGKKEKILIKVWTLAEYEDLKANETDNRRDRGTVLHGYSSIIPRSGEDEARGDD